MAKKMKVLKIDTPEISEIPVEELKTEEFEEAKEDKEDEILNQKVVAELTQLKKEVLELSKDKNKTDLTKKEKIEILQDYAVKKVRENEILQEKIKKDMEKYHKKQRENRLIKPDTVIQKAKRQIRKIEVAYIEFYPDTESKVYTWIPLHTFSPIITHPKRKELFLLDEPAKFLNGKAVYILIHKFPFSIPMHFFIEDLVENQMKMPKLPRDDKGNVIFGRAYLSPTDQHAIYTSIKTIMLFGIRRSVISSIIIYAFCFIMGMMTLYIIISPYLFAK